MCVWCLVFVFVSVPVSVVFRHGKIFGRHMKICSSVAEQVSNNRSEYAYNSELSRGTTYLTQLSSQWPEITTAPQLVPAVHSGVDRGKLETSRGAAVRRIRLFFHFPSPGILSPLGNHPFLSGKEVLKQPHKWNLNQRITQSKQFYVTFFRNAKSDTDLNLRVCLTKNTPKPSQKTDLFESVRKFLL